LAVAVTPRGRRAVTAFNDNTLKVRGARAALNCGPPKATLARRRRAQEVAVCVERQAAHEVAERDAEEQDEQNARVWANLRAVDST
jgi:hypothetical protein